jgi:hypothetical protein
MELEAWGKKTYSGDKKVYSKRARGLSLSFRCKVLMCRVCERRWIKGERKGVERERESKSPINVMKK